MTILRHLRAFARARAGLAALEFALIAPIMLFILFGAVELTNALNAVRRVENLAASIADVISRDTAVTDAEIEDIWHATEPLMFPDNPIGARIRITSILVEDATTARVVWSEGHGGLAGLTPDSTITLPPAMRIPGRGVIMTDVVYPYDPVLSFVFGDRGLHTLVDPQSDNHGAFDIEQTAYRPTRLVDPLNRIAG